MKKIICAGLMCEDIIARPVDGFDMNADMLVVDKIEIKNGGDAMNNAVVLAKLGADVTFVGRVGRDEQGDFLKRKLEGAGIETHLVFDQTAPTSTSVVMTKANGDRSFVYCTGANANLTEEDVPDELLKRADHLQAGGILNLTTLRGENLARLFKRAKSFGLTTSFDVTFDKTGRWFEGVEPVLPLTDYFLPSIGEARMIAGSGDPDDCADFFLEHGAGTVVIKLGERGCLLKTSGLRVEVPAFKAGATIDTTGAGDAFCGGFLYGVLNDRPVLQCAEIGAATAAVCVTKLGATEGAPSWREVEKILESGVRL